MLDELAKKDIEKISLDILSQSKSIDVFPTPVDQLLKYSNLVLNHQVDLSTVHESFYHKASVRFKQAMGKVRGFLDRREKVIFLDLSVKMNRQNFVKLHEIGHEVLPWQGATLQFLDNDETLDGEVKELFEAEANFFASVTLFQHDRFAGKIENLPLDINTSFHLAKHFGASIHATLRRYVECSNKRCSLLVLKDVSSKGQLPICSVRDYFQSSSFSKDFGKVEWTEQLGYTWPFVKEYYHGKRHNRDGELVLTTSQGQIGFVYHFFNSTYNAFVFLFPKGEKISSKTKFIISGT
jgi:hypothetical protein